MRIALPDGSDPEQPFQLADGASLFLCYETYIDGDEEFFAAYRTCPLFERGGGVQLWSVFGRQRRTGVTVHLQRSASATTSWRAGP